MIPLRPFLSSRHYYSSTSSKWFREHVSDSYVRRSKADGYRARSAYKLIQMDEKYRLLRPDKNCVLDCGASPGSWSQVVSQKLRSSPGAKLMAVDLLPIEPIDQVEIMQMDATSAAFFELLSSRLAGRSIDLLLSDMSPNISGIWHLDSIRSKDLAASCFTLVDRFLSPSGTFLVKLFHGVAEKEFMQSATMRFRQVSRVKPLASRSASAEIYVLCQGYHHRNENENENRNKMK